MRILASLIICTAVAGCATQAELIAQKQREVDQMIVLYGPACERLGYTANTDGWRDCILQLGMKDRLEYNRFATTSCWGSPGFTQCTIF